MSDFVKMFDILYFYQNKVLTGLVDAAKTWYKIRKKYGSLFYPEIQVYCNTLDYNGVIWLF